MYSEINEFMRSKQARFDAETGLVWVNDRDCEQYSDEDAFALTPQFSALSITGDDAQAFLQGQFSSDVAGLGSGDAQLTTYSNAKGRMQASLLLVRIDGGFLAIIRSDLLERFTRRLAMFVMRSKVKIDMLDSARIAVWRARVVQGEFAVLHRDQHVIDIVLKHGLCIRCDLLMGSSFEKLGGSVRNSTWAELAMIREDIPWVSAATFEAFVPQMANFDVLGSAISFKKGCYPGQEIVARTQYLGKVKRRLFRVLAAGMSVSAGDDIFAVNTDGQSIGKVAMACRVQEGSEALVVMQIAAWEAEPYVVNAAGENCSLRRLSQSYDLVAE